MRVYNSQLEYIYRIRDFQAINFTRKYTGTGAARITLASDDAANYYLQKNHFLVIDEEPYVIKHIEQGLERTLIQAYTCHALLDQRLTGKGSHKTEQIVSVGTADAVVKDFINRSKGDLPITTKADQADPITVRDITRLKKLGDEVKRVLDLQGRGEKFTIEDNTLYFDTYKGADKTTEVIFSADLGNLAELVYTETAVDDKTTVYIGGAGEGADREMEVVGDDAAGLDRIEVFSDARDVDEGDTEELINRAEQLLTSTQKAITATLMQGNFELGDLVTVRFNRPSLDGNTKKDETTDLHLRITEMAVARQDGEEHIDLQFGTIPLLDSDPIKELRKKMSQMETSETPIERITEQVKGDIEETLIGEVEDLNEFANALMGLYTTKVTLPDNSEIIYSHDEEQLEDSAFIATKHAGAIAWTTTGWNDGHPAWQYGVDQTGNAIFRLVSTVGLNANWLNAGKVKAQYLEIGPGTDFTAGYDPTKLSYGQRNYLLQSGQAVDFAEQSDIVTSVQDFEGRNLILNSALSSIDNWSSHNNNNTTLSVSENILTGKGSGNSRLLMAWQQVDIPFEVGRKIYAKAKLRVLDTGAESLGLRVTNIGNSGAEYFGQVNFPDAGVWYYFSGIVTLGINLANTYFTPHVYFDDAANAKDKEFEVQGGTLYCVDLTKEFGPGNEPSEYFADWQPAPEDLTYAKQYQLAEPLKLNTDYTLSVEGQLDEWTGVWLGDGYFAGYLTDGRLTFHCPADLDPEHIIIKSLTDTATIDRVMLSQSTTRQDWLPAPEDVQALLDKKADTDSLGDLAYDDLVELAKLGSTIISGGYLETSLVKIDGSSVFAAGYNPSEKRRIFTSTPVPPYDVGDLWTEGSTGDINRCKTTKAAGGSYSAADWELASKYTDDTAVNSLSGSLGDLAYQNKVSDAMLDSTVIVGGYIKTSLISVDDLYAIAAKIGGWSITSTLLQYKPNVDNNNNRMYLSSDPADTYRMAAYSATGNRVFSISNIGGLFAASGTIGGWNIQPTYIDTRSGNARLYLSSHDDASDYYMAAINTNSDTVFFVSKAGKLYSQNAEIVGKITAGDGKIGGWGLTSTALDYKPNSGDNKKRFYISADPAGDYRLRSFDADGNAKFTVTAEGKLMATDADVSGKITASSGKIGDFDLTNGLLISKSATQAVQISSDVNSTPIWIGDAAFTTPKFRVLWSGKMYSEDAEIKGKITSTSGSIGGFTIGATTLTGSKVTITTNQITINGANLKAAASSGWLEISATGLQISNQTLSRQIVPVAHNSYNLGSDTVRWKTVYGYTLDYVSLYQGSDFRMKSEIESIPDELISRIQVIQPKMYEMGGRKMVGFVAQDIEREVFQYSYEKTKDRAAAQEMQNHFGLITKEESYLSYNPIEMLILKMQGLENRIKELEGAEIGSRR